MLKNSKRKMTTVQKMSSFIFFSVYVKSVQALPLFASRRTTTTPTNSHRFFGDYRVDMHPQKLPVPVGALNLFGRKNKEQMECVEIDHGVTDISILTTEQEQRREDSSGDSIKGVLDESESAQKTEILRFGGKQNYTSAEISLPSDMDLRTIYTFFAKEENQKVLLTGGKHDADEESVEDMEDIDTQTLEPASVTLWKENAKSMGADKPILDEDKVVKVRAQGIGILNVGIYPVTTIGVKLKPSSEMVINGKAANVSLPEYQAVLIHDDPIAKGPRPLVWLFNKIVYGTDPDSPSVDTTPNAKATRNRRNRNEKAMLRVWAELRPPCETSKSGDGNKAQNRKLVFMAESEIWLEFEFPKLLLRFFPLSKEKAEQICSDAIVGALDMNLAPAIDKFTALYLEQVQGAHIIS